MQNFEESVCRYPYVSHLILNAGVGSFCAIDWIGAFKQLIVEPVNGVTAPKYYTQHSGEISIDGLGWVWQSNLFGHYVLVRHIQVRREPCLTNVQYRSLEHLLHASPPPLGSRVIWSSSIEASPDYFDPDDWQNKKSAHSYESTKYQIDLISTRLDQLALQKPACQRIRHLLSHPGVCSTNVANALIGPVLNLCKLFAFYLVCILKFYSSRNRRLPHMHKQVRLLGSPNHPIDPLKGAVAAVHLSLAPLAFITLFYQNLNDSPRPSKFGAESDWWGNERVGVMDVKKWGENEKESDILLSKLDALYQAFSPANGVPPKSGIASELM
ncbi:hypothetical protein H0H93_003729 [Arthromyces matolae]|nr:hypothetical protein H0H93_003729 [Arthromyces matolae]